MMTRRLPAAPSTSKKIASDSASSILTAQRMISIRGTCPLLIGLKYMQILAQLAEALTACMGRSDSARPLLNHAWAWESRAARAGRQKQRAARFFPSVTGSIPILNSRSPATPDHLTGTPARFAAGPLLGNAGKRHRQECRTGYLRPHRSSCGTSLEQMPDSLDVIPMDTANLSCTTSTSRASARSIKL